MINPIAREIVKAIFEGRETILIGNKVIHRIMFKQGTVRCFDIGEWRWIEQNPNTESSYAMMAKDGHKICWVIHKPTNDWKALIIDGKVHEKNTANGKWKEVGTIFDHVKGTL